ERGVVMGLWCTNYAVGGMVASIYAGYVGEKFGWRYAFFVPALTLLGVWVLFLIFQRNTPEEVGLPAIETYHAGTDLTPDAVISETGPENSWQIILKVL